MANHYQVAIIGAGTAGLTAALYAARSGLSVLVAENRAAGGQIVASPEVENYPGVEKISGIEFIETLRKQAEKFGAVLINGETKSFRLETSPKAFLLDNKKYSADTVVLANGARHRKLGCSGEERLTGRGVSYCAACDGAFFVGKTYALSEEGTRLSLTRCILQDFAKKFI